MFKNYGIGFRETSPGIYVEEHDPNLTGLGLIWGPDGGEVVPFRQTIQASAEETGKNAEAAKNAANL